MSPRGSTAVFMNARVKALGAYLVEEGVLTPEQLPSVLGRQLEDRARGRLLQFGEVVVEMGLATPDQV